MHFDSSKEVVTQPRLITRPFKIRSASRQKGKLQSWVEILCESCHLRSEMSGVGAQGITILSRLVGVIRQLSEQLTKRGIHSVDERGVAARSVV